MGACFTIRSQSFANLCRRFLGVAYMKLGVIFGLAFRLDSRTHVPGVMRLFKNFAINVGSVMGLVGPWGTSSGSAYLQSNSQFFTQPGVLLARLCRGSHQD